MGKKISLFLDSGAYSSLTMSESINERLAGNLSEADRITELAKLEKVQIDINAYIAFIKEHKNELTVYANLDVIGDAEATWENQKIMEAAGLNPLPAFHRGEDWKWLKKYLDEYDYIAIGGIAGEKDRQNVLQWLDDCWDRICDTPDRMPKARIHGFGITSVDAMVRFPWFSVDSTSWIMTGRFGSIYVPRYRNGKYVYEENTWKVAISNQSPAMQKKGQHFTNMSNMEQEQILDYLHLKGFKMGKSEFKDVAKGYELKVKDGERWAGEDFALEDKKLFDTNANEPDKKRVEIIIEPGLVNDYRFRDEANITYFVDMENNLPAWPWAWRRKGVVGFDVRRKAL